MLGELVQTTAGKWIIHPPTRCPNGHQLGPNQALVGYQACLGHGGGHTTWTCLSCDETVYGPPLNTHCSVLDGPATVRDLDQARVTRRDSRRPGAGRCGRRPPWQTATSHKLGAEIANNNFIELMNVGCNAHMVFVPTSSEPWLVRRSSAGMRAD